MSQISKILRLLLIIVCMAVAAGCASARQNPWQKKRQQASKVHTSQLGRNRFYFSPGYQKKLIQGYKRKK